MVDGRLLPQSIALSPLAASRVGAGRRRSVEPATVPPKGTRRPLKRSFLARRLPGRGTAHRLLSYCCQPYSHQGENDVHRFSFALLRADPGALPGRARRSRSGRRRGDLVDGRSVQPAPGAAVEDPDRLRPGPPAAPDRGPGPRRPGARGRPRRGVDQPPAPPDQSGDRPREGRSRPPQGGEGPMDDLKGEEPRAPCSPSTALPLPLDPDGARPSCRRTTCKSFHLLTAQVDFQPDTSVRRDIVYGGEYGSEVSTELTGVPVQPAAAGCRRPASSAAGSPRRQAAGRRRRRGGAGQALHRRASAGPNRSETGQKMESKREVSSTRHPLRGCGSDSEDESARRPLSRHGSRAPARTARPVPDLAGRSIPGTRGSSVVLLMTARRPQRGRVPAPRFTDAVAAAGLEAITENRRRAVLLLLSGQEKDAEPVRPRARSAASSPPCASRSSSGRSASPSRDRRRRPGAPRTSPRAPSLRRGPPRSGRSSTRSGS